LSSTDLRIIEIRSLPEPLGMHCHQHSRLLCHFGCIKVG